MCIIGIAGGTCSGKSTLAGKLENIYGHFLHGYMTKPLTTALISIISTYHQYTGVTCQNCSEDICWKSQCFLYNQKGNVI